MTEGGMRTLDEIRDAVNHVFRETDKPANKRVVKIHRYCSTADALITYSTPFSNVCSSENCDNCKEFHTLMKQEAESQITVLKNR